MTSIADNIQVVWRRIRDAEIQSGRPAGSAQLLAVSKAQPVDALRTATAAGQVRFGENYLQEALPKIAALRDIPGLEWHFIGPLQSNKTRAVAEQFDWVHSVDRLKIAERLAAQRPPHLPPLQVCLQVNLSHEDTKSGLDLNDALPLALQIAALPGLSLRGLMAIPSPEWTDEQLHAGYRQLRETQQAIAKHLHAFDTLSIGMSDDLEIAIAEGATIVRIGTALFGQRAYPAKEEST